MNTPVIGSSGSNESGDSNETPTLAEYYNLLALHDWYYSYSDERRIYQQGKLYHDKLLGWAKSSDAHQALYDGFYRHHFSGMPWSSEKAPLPARPMSET